MEGLVEIRGKTILIGVPRDILEGAAADSDNWRGTHVEKMLAEITKAPEYAKVAALEERRAKAVSVVEDMEARIGEIKAACSEKIVESPMVIDQAAGEIEECEKAIKTAKLSLDTVDTLLPEAIQARYSANKKLVHKTIGQLMDKLQQERQAGIEAVLEAIKVPGRTLLDLNCRIARLSTMTNLQPEHVLTCAASRGGDPQES